MINLETPKKIRPLVDQAHQVAMNMLRPISRKYDEAEHEYPKELDMLAAMIDGISESGATGGAGAAGVRRDEKPEEKKGKQERRQPRLRALHHGDVLGRRRPAPLDAAPGAGQLRDRLGGQRRAAGAVRRHVGRDGDHRAGHRFGLRQHPDHRDQGRRRVRPQRREDLRHLRRARRQRRRLGDPRQEPRARGDQVVRGQEGQPRACGWSGSSTSSASAPPTPP